MRKTIILMLCLISSALNAQQVSLGEPKKVLDMGRVEPAANVFQIPVNSAAQVRSAILTARSERLKISIRGTNHSQGGHNFLADENGFPRAVQLITAQWNRVINIDQKKQLATVEPGVTWRQLQQELNKFGLAVLTQQSSNIFSVGGAVATNIHGRDIYGAMINSVESIKLITADGEEVVASRTENPELFFATVGGYGALGVISQVTLRVIKNLAYTARSAPDLDVTAYLKQYIEPLRAIEQGHELHWARVSIETDKENITLGPISAVTWVEANPQPPKSWSGWDLSGQNTIENKLSSALMAASRASNAGKAFKSSMERLLGMPANDTLKTRNNIMNPPIDFLIDYSNNAMGENDILQEYFIPPESLGEFLSFIEKVAQRNYLNLLNITLRYVPSSKENGVISYAGKGDLIAVVLYINIIDRGGLKQRQIDYSGIHWTRELIDETVRLKGKFYLPYQRWWNYRQLEAAFGGESWSRFKTAKIKYDPDYLFDSNFIRAVMRIDD